MLYLPTFRHARFCRATHDGFFCTRAAGHSGRHAATGKPTRAGRPLFAVWGQQR